MSTFSSTKQFFTCEIFVIFVTPQVCFVNDPRPENPYDKLYTVEYLGNMTGGAPVVYINQEVQASFVLLY